jgi:ribosomal protein S12 methylthiotransferase accessory factor
LDESAALIPSLAEGLERYSTAVYHNEQFLWATAEELGADALDLDTVPRCSALELQHPKCPLIRPDKTQRIRWVKAISLLGARPVYVPAIMVYSHIGYASAGERFWIPISTGCAAHVSYEQAILAGIREVVERDALTITWLQKLPLPRIDSDRIPLPLNEYWTRYNAASSDLSYFFFDATTDIGVPAVYSLQVAIYDRKIKTLVACATGNTLLEAMAKAMCDMASVRGAFRENRVLPCSWDDFTDMFHGSTFMAKAESADAFDFLLSGNSPRQLREADGFSEPAALSDFTDRLRHKGLDTFIVDLSTDEALRSGMRVVRVIVPGLQPLSFRYRARFLGHPRLYTAPLTMGYRSLPEESINNWPQPFA